MKTLCLYFQIHQPFRLRRYRFFDIGNDHYYYDDYANETIMRKIAEKSYLPANVVLQNLINEYGSKFKIAFSISGLALEQMEMYAPDVLKSFQKLADTGNVEFLAETYSHSLASLKSETEFKKQVNKHKNRIHELFGQTPKVFRNTELIYSDDIGAMVYKMGFETMLTEGAKHVLGWKSPNYLYCNSIHPKLKVLLKNFKLSDDIAFRFSNKSWPDYPLTPEKFVLWLNQVDSKEETVNLFMDYETFGEHQWKDTGIFDFLEELPERVLSNSKYVFATPSEVAKNLQPVSALQVPYPISWADEERDLTAWLGNDLQKDAFEKLYSLTDKINRTTDETLLQDWEYLQSGDHFYYMCTKYFSDGDVHMYFNPYETPYDAYINYMNVLSDFAIRLNAAVPETDVEQEIFRLSQVIEEKDKQIEKYEKQLKRKGNRTAGTKKKNTEKKAVDKERKSSPSTAAESKKQSAKARAVKSTEKSDNKGTNKKGQAIKTKPRKKGPTSKSGANL
jgi:alpha-amylase